MNNIIMYLIKGFLGEEVKAMGAEILKKVVNYIHAELKKGFATEDIGMATALNYNIPYQLAFTLVTIIKKFLKI